MTPFTRLHAVAAPFTADNVDTDQILSKAFLKVTTRSDLGPALFHELRFTAAGDRRPGFILNQLPFRTAGILLTGENFGCGSSREHAVWALVDFGIRCLIGPSFADIFQGNCANNGVLLVTLDPSECSALALAADGRRFGVDLEACQIHVSPERTIQFKIDPQLRVRLLNGADTIRQTEQFDVALSEFELLDRRNRPWAWTSPPSGQRIGPR